MSRSIEVEAERYVPIGEATDDELVVAWGLANRKAMDAVDDITAILREIRRRTEKER
jgi:hypothetical protein